MPEPTPEMLALEAQLESLGDWRAQLDDELAQMADQTRRINRLASSGARNDTPARPRHAPAATGDAPEGPAAQPAGEGGWKPGDPRAAGAASPRGAQPSGHRPAILSEYWQQIASGLVAEAATLQMTDGHAVAKWVGRATSTLAEALRISEANGNG